MGTTGRNAPCPCGSGKKHKHCCLGKEEVAPATDLHVVDKAVTERIDRWIDEAHPDALRQTLWGLPDGLKDNDDALGFVTMLVTYEMTTPDGDRVCLLVPDAVKQAFTPPELQWFEAQTTSWFSIWDVIDVRRNRGFLLRDVFTHEERFVREKEASRDIRERDLLLARTVRRDTTWVLAATHPYTLPPQTGEAVAAEGRQQLDLGADKVDPERLRGDAAFRLTSLWQEAVQRIAGAPPPRLQNTEGDPLVPTDDVYAFDPAARDALLSGLRLIPDLEETQEPSEPGAHRLRLHRPVEGQGDDRVILIADLEVGRDTLTVTTNSTRRADEVRDRLEATLGKRLRFLERSTGDPWDLLPEGPPKSGPPISGKSPSMADAALIVELKKRHYETWPDIPLPALDNHTPRDAARDNRTKAYRQLDTLLRDLEQSENGEPHAQRYDVQALRRELGMA